MDIKIDSLIPLDAIKTDAERIFSIVDKNGKVVLLKDNQPAYIIKYDSDQELASNNTSDKFGDYTLQEAMRLVLLDAENNTMRASKLADKIYRRRLYLQKTVIRRSTIKFALGADIIPICSKHCQLTILS